MDNNEILKNNNIEGLKRRLNNLKNKEKNIEELGEFSKRLYSSSIPVMLIFTTFIELINSLSFNINEYLILNGISLPIICLINNFVCGTSISRKKQLSVIDNEIMHTQEKIKTLTIEQIKSKNLRISNIQIKPIDRTYEINNHKDLTKKLTK